MFLNSIHNNLENVYVLIVYDSWYSNEKKKYKNNICCPINTELYNLDILINIDIDKNNNKIISEDDKSKISNALRFSNGPYYFEKPTHILINNKGYFQEYELKRSVNFNIIDI